MDFEDVSKERRFDKAKNQSRCQLCFNKNVVTILKKYNREQEVIMEESKRRSGPSQPPKVAKIEKKITIKHKSFFEFRFDQNIRLIHINIFLINR